MTRSKLILLALCSIFVLTACNKTETYAELKDKERSAINQFIVDRKIKVISETDFKSNGEVTNVADNEFVLFGSTGVYMQIVEKGCGEKIKKGETLSSIARKYHTTVANLKKWNKLKSDLIREGQRIIVAK